MLGVADRPDFDPNHRGVVTAGGYRTGSCPRMSRPHSCTAAATNTSPPLVACDRPIRRRLDQWADRGLGTELLQSALTAYDRMLGLDLDDLSVDGSITKSLHGGEVSGR